jgi:hypothetical protein
MLLIFLTKPYILLCDFSSLILFQKIWKIFIFSQSNLVPFIEWITRHVNIINSKKLHFFFILFGRRDNFESQISHYTVLHLNHEHSWGTRFKLYSISLRLLSSQAKGENQDTQNDERNGSIWDAANWVTTIDEIKKYLEFGRNLATRASWTCRGSKKIWRVRGIKYFEELNKNRSIFKIIVFSVPRYADVLFSYWREKKKLDLYKSL